ncbi:Lrp/AsnC family transcriptional regulator [soil metagenome]
MELDEIDRSLVELLTEDSRMTNARLAERAGIAPSTCLARVRGLLARGVITGFTTTIDPAAVDLRLQALISVAIRAGARQHISEFEADVTSLPEVVQCFFVGGSEDFVLHLAVRNSDELRDFVLEHLSAHPAVASTRTSVVFTHSRNGISVPR